MAMIFVDSKELEKIKNKIKLVKHELEDEMRNLSPDEIDTELLGDTSATYKALTAQLEKVVKQLNSLAGADGRCDSIMKYIDDVISKYSGTDRSLAQSVDGGQQG